MNRIALILIALVLAVAMGTILATSWQDQVTSPDTAPASQKQESTR